MPNPLISSGGVLLLTSGVPTIKSGAQPPTAVAASITNRRMNVIDLGAEGATGAISVTSQPANGRAIPYGDQLLAVDLNDVTSTTTLSITCQDGTSSEYQITATVADSTQSMGWYEGQHLSYPLSGGQYDLLPGEGTYQAYLTKGTATWDNAALEAEPGAPTPMTGAWIASQWPTYGSASNNTLDASSGEAGELLYNHVNNVGATFYLERGFDYTNLDPKSKYGESCTYPFRISAYGTGDRPDTLGKTFNFVTATQTPTTRFFVLEECHPTSVMSYNTGGAAHVFHKCLISYAKPSSETESAGIAVSQKMGLMTFENCAMFDVYRSAPVSGDPNQWHRGENDKTMALFVATSNDILVKDCFFDYCGWREGYNDDALYNSGTYPQPPSRFSHNIYFADSRNTTIRGNISCRAASMGMKSFDPAYWEMNAWIHNPIGHNHLENGAQDPRGYMCDEVATKEGQTITYNYYGGRQGLGFQESSYEGSMIRIIAIHQDGPGASSEGLDLNEKGAAYAVDDCMSYDWSPDSGVSGLTTATLDALTIEDFTDTELSAASSTVYDLIAHYRTLENFRGEARKVVDYFQTGFQTAGKTSFAIPTHSGSPETVSYEPDSSGRTPGLRWETRLDWDTLYLPEDGDTVNLNGFTVWYYENNLALNTLNLGAGGGPIVTGGHLSATSALTTGTGGSTMKTMFGGRITIPGYTDTEGLTVTVEGGLFAFAGTVSGPCSVTVGLGLIPYADYTKNITNKGYCVLGEGGDTFTVASGETLTIEGGGLAGTDATSGTFNITVESGGTLHFAEKQDDGGSYLVGEIREFRSGRNGTTDPSCTFNITLEAGSNVTKDTANMGAGTYDLAVCDTLTDNGATLASNISVVSGTTLRLTV